MSATATRDGLSLIAVILKGPTSDIRFNESKKLLDYGFSNYSYKEMAKQNEVVKNILVTKGTQHIIEAVYETTKGTLVKKGNEKNIVQNITISEEAIAPIKKGDKLRRSFLYC